MSSSGYTVVRSLGVGALSEALLARRGDRHVVVKRLHRHLAHDPAFVEMFTHEARVLDALAHEGIAALVEPPRCDGQWEFVQALAPGVELVARLAAALHHVHERRDAAGLPLAIVHRDVCPANVVVARDGRVTLVDFGIANSVWRPVRERGRLEGTRGYMAPEVITGERDLDGRVDLFAAAVILFELTVGRRLYEGNAARVMAAIADGPVPSPAREVEGYPEALDAVVRRGLARDADERYATGDAFAQALDEALASCGTARSREALASALGHAYRALPRDVEPPPP